MSPELLSLLTLPIPLAKPPPNGFLEIAGMAHYENVNSRIYAHFLNSEHEGVRSSFLDALLQLVHEKCKKDISLHSYTATLENVTDKKKRIDILLEDKGNKTAIIIENKIYHHSKFNDLNNYWNHIQYPKENKVGVLLTLKQEVIAPQFAENFINITHSEWIGCIRANGLSDDIPPNYYLYINDFAATIDHLTKSYAMNEHARFYFENAPKIIQAKHTMDAANRFIDHQLNYLCSKLGWEKHNSTSEWRNIRDNENKIDTFFTIWFKPILHGKMEFSIFLELTNKDKERMSNLESVLANCEQFKQMKHGKPKKNYIHFGLQHYPLTMEELEHFGEHLYQLILRDFAETIVTIIKYYYPDKNIDKWLPNFDLKNTK
jgi:PD-(D/E)XK nuclease superfamily